MTPTTPLGTTANEEEVGLHLLTAASPQSDLEAFGGGKALNLYRLTTAGIAVPRWAALGSDVFSRYLRVSAIGAGLDDVDDGARLARSIEATEVDDCVRALIEAAYREVGGGRVCVRSSGGEEDSAARSFAGQFASYINVRSFEEVVRCVRRCWASAFSARALAYRAADDAADINIAVIVQTMIVADRSGVLFTANPVTSAPDEAVISAVYGMGEGLVSGSIDADNITVDRRTGRIIDTRVGAKQMCIEPRPEGPGCDTRSVDAVRRNTLALEHDEIAELVRVGDNVAALLGAEQDIEWTYADGELWLLQSRPITTLGEAATPPTARESALPQIWDNSSASENFGDITTPLTYSFVSHVTHQIYREHFRRLWVPYAELREMDGWLGAMFGYFNGRMYNNLTNWVRVNRLLPFAALRRSVMHAAMGLTGPIEQDIVDRAAPFESVATRRGRMIRAVIAVRFAWRFATVGVSVRRFLKRFEAQYAKVDVDYSGWSSDEIYRLFRSIDLVRDFGSALLLHPAISLAVGALQRVTNRWLPDAPSWFHYQAATPSGGIASVAPAERLLALTAMVSEQPQARNIVCNTPPERARDELLGHGAGEIVAAVDAYIADFGYRSVNELKLEEPCLRERPDDFYVILADSLRAALARGDARHDTGAVDVDAYLREHLSPPKRAAYAVVRGNARRLLRAREGVRFCRTRAFGAVRTMMLAIGKDLADIGALDAPRDVFYLRLKEVRWCFEAGLYPNELKAAVAARREAEERYRTLHPPRRFETHGPVYWWRDASEAAWSAPEPTSAIGAGDLTGVPCCPGIVEGEVRLMDTPGNAQGGIVATYRTDPGWATVLPSAAALLVEIGSPLNHVAIVARELGVPTIVQIQGLTRTLRTGMRVRVDGGAGTISVSSTEGE